MIRRFNWLNRANAAKKRPPILFAVAGFALPAAAGEDSWAVNLAGPDVASLDGTLYRADTAGGGKERTIGVVKGAQDARLYAQCREGDFQFSQELPAGSYDVSLHFAEPDEPGAGERVFDVLLENRIVINKLDIIEWKSRGRSALELTVPGIEVGDGALDVGFRPHSGEPLLCALAVRRQPSRTDEWRLAWNDEFDVEGAPDSAKWTIETWPPRRVNDEDQAYTDRRTNLRVENGHLVIEARREDYGDAQYTSGRLHSSGKGDLLYGRVDVRAQLPRGQGTWPAIWMMPSDVFTYATTCDADTGWQSVPPCDAWPNSGEIDIMEHVGYQMNHVHSTVHTKAYYWVNNEQRSGRILLDDVADAFHVYTVEWSPEKIEAFVDGSRYFAYVNEHEGWEQWPFDHPFHVILNVAVGGFWGRAGGPIDDGVFPQRMLVDYVRLYTKNDP